MQCKSRPSHGRQLLVFAALFLVVQAQAFSAPYNFRAIDQHVYAGGHPLGPATNFKNTDQQTLAILSYLKSLGIETVIDLENTRSIQKRYEKLLKQAEIVRLHIPMSAEKVPNALEWKKIKQAMERPVYVHCKWGADRTGAVIGRYLIEVKGYKPEVAYKAVISGGKCAGPLGGLKIGPDYYKLKQFILTRVQ